MTEAMANSYQLPGKESIFRQSCAEGTTLLAYPNPTSPAVFFRGYLPVGALSDPVGKEGLANLNAAMLSTGTLNHDFRAFHQQIESIGASLSVSAGNLSTLFGGQCLKEDLPRMLDLLLEMLSQPAFPENHFERLRQQLLTVLRINAQNTEEMAAQTFDRLYYRGHPFGRPLLGNQSSVENVTLADLREFHQTYFGPKGLVLAISGGIDPIPTRELFEEKISGWQVRGQKCQADLPPFEPPNQPAREHFLIRGKSQSDLIIGTQAPQTGGEGFFASLLGNNILGQFGMMGRIGESVREKSGLAYVAGSSLETGLGPVCWRVFAGVNPQNLNEAITKIIAELQRFINEPVTPQELDDVRSQTLGHLPLSFETNSGIVRYLLNLQRYNLDLDFLKTLPQKLAEITPEEILEQARRYWDLDKLIIASAGREQ